MASSGQKVEASADQTAALVVAVVDLEVEAVVAWEVAEEAGELAAEAVVDLEVIATERIVETASVNLNVTVAATER